MFFYKDIFDIKWLMNIVAKSFGAVEYANCISAEGKIRPPNQIVSWIWYLTMWWWGSNLEALGNVKYSFITITPRSTLTQSGSAS